MAEAQLAVGNQETLNTNPDAATEAFKAQVEKSKANLAESETPPKRGRGRPPKNKTVSEPPAAGATSQPSVSGPPPPADMSPYLIDPLIMISKIPARRADIPELALTADEAKMCADSLNNLLNVFIPDVSQISPRSAAVISSATVFGAVIFQKYQIYLITMQERRELNIAKSNTPAPPTEPGTAFPTEHVGPLASDHFARRPQA